MNVKVIQTGVVNPHIVLGKDLLENVVYENLGSQAHMRTKDDAKYYFKKNGKLFYMIKEKYDDVLQESAIGHVWIANDRFVPRPDLKFEFEE